MCHEEEKKTDVTLEICKKDTCDDDDGDADDEEYEEADDEDEDDDDDDDDREDDDEDGDADEEDEDDDDEEEEDEDSEPIAVSQDQKDFDELLASVKLGMPSTPVVVPSAESWKLLCQQHLALNAQAAQSSQPLPHPLPVPSVQGAEEPLELSSQDYPAVPPPACTCPHYVTTIHQPSSQVSLCYNFSLACG